jgi:hypothetical protein
VMDRLGTFPCLTYLITDELLQSEAWPGANGSPNDDPLTPSRNHEVVIPPPGRPGPGAAGGIRVRLGVGSQKTTCAS